MSRLRAGAARACITPHLGCHICGYFNDRIAEDIADDLFAKAVVLENGDTSIAIVVLDLIMASRADCEQAKRRAERLTDIPAENIFISCTHTHFGPATTTIFNAPREEAYMDWAMDRAGDAVKLAQNRLRDARVGHGSGSCPEETHNRRRHMTDGTVRMNPGYQNPDAVKPAGPTDPEVGLIALVDDESRPIAALANYSLHYVGGPFPLSISADYFGAFDRALQRMAGDEFVAVMMNGCCGDINNCDFTAPGPEYPHPFYQVERVADMVASRAYGAWQRIRDWDPSPTLAAAANPMTFRRREATPEDLVAARAVREGKQDPTDREWMYAGEVIEVSREPVERETVIGGLRIGSAGIVGMPGEVFVEMGLAVKRRSPFERTFVVELANDYCGYIPTDKALAEGSYETRLARTAKAASGTEGVLVDTCVDTLQQLLE